MQGSKTRLLASVALMVLAAASCTNDSLDDGSTADVILEILNLDAPAVRAQRQSSTQGTCSVSGVLCDSNADCGLNEVCARSQECTLEVEEWTAIIQAAPKNSLATPPYNDVVMTSVDISYEWLNSAIFTPNRTVGLGNITIPALQSAPVTFFPIASDDVNANPAIEGASANLTLTFRGQTVEGTGIRQTVLRQLQVEVCN